MPIIKRRSSTSKYVYSEKGHLVIRTPAECTNWPQDFRVRLISEYASPDTVMNLTTFQQKYLSDGKQKHIYDVQGKPLMVRQPHTIDRSNHTAIIRGTEIVDVRRQKAIMVSHHEPAMRVMIVYTFLIDSLIGGVPKQNLYDAADLD